MSKVTLYVASLSLLQGAKVGFYDSVEAIDADSGKAGTALNLANRYMSEKGALVEFRDVFATKLAEATGFAMLTKTVTKKYKDGTSEDVVLPNETEVKFVNRFRAACAAGEVTGWPKEEAAVEAKLQEFADSLGQFDCDSSTPVREGKSKNPPKYALEAAANVIKNGSQAKWQGIFANEGITHQPFDTDDANANTIALAWAIKAREDAKAKNEYQ